MSITISQQNPCLADTCQSPLIIALDYASSAHALTIAKQIDPKTARLKVGKQLFVSEGPQIVEQLQQLGFEIFLDLKFHDIPNTVAQACISAANLGVWMTNVHATGGATMMKTVVDGLANLSHRPLITGVTVLTSMDQATFQQIGFSQPIEDTVIHLAELCQSNGLDGVVCSAQEASVLRKKLGKDFLLVTPGIRLADDDCAAPNDDQHRIMTPASALAAGADYLVIGRPITQSNNPNQVIEKILEQIKRS